MIDLNLSEDQMGGTAGGTKMYCANCATVRVCKAVPTTDVVSGIKPGQRWWRLGHDDLQFFRRGRECLTCSEQWLSVEILEDQMKELIELREALADLKKHADSYSEQAKSAAVNLKRLTASLGALKA